MEIYTNKRIKKIILYITTPIDGRIAQYGEEMDWLIGFPNPGKTDYGYHDLQSFVDTVVRRDAPTAKS